jgi:hypothetical protein
MAKTKELIVKASNLGISIIIVGLNKLSGAKTEFGQMEELDGDSKRLTD